MIRISMPDPLSWETGIVYGLQALTRMTAHEIPFECLLPDSGPQYEEVAFSIYQLELDAHVRLVPYIRYRALLSDIVVFPRLCSLEARPIKTALRLNKTVITSDPELDFSHPKLHRFQCRDHHALANSLISAVAGLAKVAAPEKI
ncbi:MAG: hypothetical protein R3335_09335 [Anaerolineales bacterium]|nr:hypothetical protein [Anaerolineales bacterium]